MTAVYIVDAFTNETFCGNQAAVCLFDQERNNEEYQKIAAEFNLSETAFPLPLNGADFKTASKFSLRWFTPKTEVPLCGHATLATAHVIFQHANNANPTLFFETLSGEVSVEKVTNGQYKINFPLYDVKSLQIENLGNPLSAKFEEMPTPACMEQIVQHFRSLTQIQGAVYSKGVKTLIILVDDTLTKEEFAKIDRSTDKMHASDPHNEHLEAVIISMRPKNAVEQGFVDKNGKAYDYVSRYFGPWVGVAEDPATGSSHCGLAALWKEFIGTEEFYAFQCCPGRGAQFTVKPLGDRVEITGDAVTVIEGKASF